jgi:hypothetical protein
MMHPYKVPFIYIINSYLHEKENIKQYGGFRHIYHCHSPHDFNQGLAFLMHKTLTGPLLFGRCQVLYALLTCQRPPDGGPDSVKPSRTRQIKVILSST